MAGNYVIIILLNVACLEMCITNISGIHFTVTAQHWSSGSPALKYVLLKVSRGEFVGFRTTAFRQE